MNEVLILAPYFVCIVVSLSLSSFCYDFHLIFVFHEQSALVGYNLSFLIKKTEVGLVMGFFHSLI